MRWFSFLFVNFMLIFSLTSVASVSLAETSLALSLNEAIVLSLRYNPNVQNSELQRIVDKINLRFAEWAYQPQFSLTANATHNQSVSEGNKSTNNMAQITPGATLLTPLGTQLSLQMDNNVSQSSNTARSYNPAVTFTITQPLLQGASRKVVLAPLKLAQNQELLNRLNLKNAIMQNITTVISQYAAVAQAENSLATLRLSLANSYTILKQQQELLHAGRIAQADLVQFEASVASQKLSLQQQEVNLHQQIRQFLITLGINPETKLKIANQAQFPTDTVPDLTECVNFALKHNTDYQQELINLAQAKIALTQAKDQQRWQLNASATRTQGSAGGSSNTGLNSLTNGLNSNTTIGLNLTVPIGNVGLQKSLVQAKVALQQEYTNLAAKKRQIINDVTNAYYTVLNQKSQITQAKIAMDLAQQSLTIAQAKLKYGKTTSFEVSTLQTNLLTQQLSYINAKTAYVTNLASLDQLIGNTLGRWRIHLTY